MARRWILLEGEAQDSLRFDRVGWAGNVVERTSAQSSHICIPIRQMGEDDDGGSASAGHQNSHCRSHIAIRQIVVAEHKLKPFLHDEGPRVCEGATGDAFESETLNNFRCVTTLKGIGGYDKDAAIAWHLTPPRDLRGWAHRRKRSIVAIILS